MPDFGGKHSLDSKGRLKQFVDGTHDWLSDRVRSPTTRLRARLAESNLQEIVFLAWAQLQPQFNELKNAIDRLTPNAMTQHGFTGSLLDFKFGIVAWANEQLELFGDVDGWMNRVMMQSITFSTA